MSLSDGVASTKLIFVNPSLFEPRCMNMLGYLILKNVLEEQYEKIFKERYEKKYANRRFEGTSVHI